MNNFPDQLAITCFSNHNLFLNDAYPGGIDSLNEKPSMLNPF